MPVGAGVLADAYADDGGDVGGPGGGLVPLAGEAFAVLRVDGVEPVLAVPGQREGDPPGVLGPGEPGDAALGVARPDDLRDGGEQRLVAQDERVVVEGRVAGARVGGVRLGGVREYLGERGG
ncbi:hypothetical protein GA0115246_115411, partial [Streptomyces sp. SolWspMP-sol7th]